MLKIYIKENGSRALNIQLRKIKNKHMTYRNVMYKLARKRCDYKILAEFEELHDRYYEMKRS